jgi:hypothetical protein
MKENDTKKQSWTYEELTAEAELCIKRVMEFALDAKQQGNIQEWQSWRDQADGIHRLWRCIVESSARNEDSDRIYAPIDEDDPPPPSLEDRPAILTRILAVAEDEPLDFSGYGGLQPWPHYRHVQLGRHRLAGGIMKTLKMEEG